MNSVVWTLTLQLYDYDFEKNFVLFFKVPASYFPKLGKIKLKHLWYLEKKGDSLNFHGLNSNYDNHIFFFSCRLVTEDFSSFFSQMKLQENEEELEPANKLSVEAC